jgi:hypothetical protein
VLLSRRPRAGAGRASHPFKVTWVGRVDFRFDTGVLFSNNHWNVRLEGVPVLSGKDDDPSDLDEVGNLKLDLPIRMVGVFNISGDLFGNGDTTHCAGDGWIYLVGDPIGTVPWIIAAILILLGLIGLVATPYVPWEQSGHDELPRVGAR